MWRTVEFNTGVFNEGEDGYDPELSYVAIWDTVSDSFVKFNHEQAWDSFEAFKADVLAHYCCVDELPDDDDGLYVADIIERGRGLWPRGGE